MTSSFHIRLSLPVHSRQMEEAVVSVLQSGWLVSGVKTAEFEEKLCEIAGRKYAVAVSSGTSALLATMVAMGIGPHSTVLIPAFTFPAPASAAAFLGASIRLCDVDPHTFNISAETLTAALDENISLVIAIDQFGAPCPAGEIEAICQQRKIPMLVDAACSLGASLGGRPCGSFGQAAVFSFHPRKIITTAEGGAVVTDDEELAETVRRFRNIGFENGGFPIVGINLRPSEMGAALGSIQLDMLDEIIQSRTERAGWYAKLPFKVQEPLADARVNHQSLVAVLPVTLAQSNRGAGPCRKDFCQFMEARGIQTQVGSYHLAQIEWMRRRGMYPLASTPHSALLHDAAVTLPLHCGLSYGDIQEVIDGCHRWLAQMGG